MTNIHITLVDIEKTPLAGVDVSCYLTAPRQWADPTPENVLIGSKKVTKQTDATGYVLFVVPTGLTDVILSCEYFKYNVTSLPRVAGATLPVAPTFEEYYGPQGIRMYDTTGLTDIYVV